MPRIVPRANNQCAAELHICPHHIVFPLPCAPDIAYALSRLVIGSARLRTRENNKGSEKSKCTSGSALCFGASKRPSPNSSRDAHEKCEFGLNGSTRVQP
jgi:hypothetical protein